MATRSGPSLFTSLRHRDWARYAAAFTISSVGNWAYSVALVVWLIQVTGSPGWVSVAAAVRYLPAVVCSAYAGVIAERFERVRLMVLVDLVQAGLMLLIAVEMALDLAPIVVVVTVGVAGAVGTIREPAAAATTPLLVPEKDLGSANALPGTIENLCIVLGPAVGGALLTLGPPWVTLAVTGATFIVSAALIAGIRARSAPVDVTEGGEAGPLQQMRIGISTIVASGPVATLVGFCLLVTFVYGTDVVLLVVISSHVLGTGAEGYGYLLAGLGVGGVLMSTLVARLERLPRLGPVIWAGALGYCLPTLLFLIVDRPFVGFLIECLRGASTLVVDVLAVTALQRSLPRDRLARVFGAFGGLCLLVAAAGSALVPLCLHLMGLTGTLWIVGVGAPLLGLLGAPGLRRADRESAARRLTLRSRAEVLARLDLMAGVGDGSIEQLATASDFLDVADGTPVVTEGDRADALYVVDAGVFVASASGVGAVELRRMGRGDYFGEIGLIEAIPRTATVTALGEGRVLRVDGEAFIAALTEGTPSIALLDAARLRLGTTHAGRGLTRAGLRDV